MIHSRFPILLESLEQRIQLSAAAMPSYPTIPISAAEQVLIQNFLANTSSKVDAVVPLRAPSNVIATASAIGITLTWSDSNTNETAINIYRSDDNSQFTILTSLIPGTTSYQDTNLKANTTYYYKIAAATANAEARSVSIAGTTDTPSFTPTPTTIPAPTSIPTPTPAPTPTTTSPITISTSQLTSFTQLNIAGTSSDDSILVTQSGSVITITANGQTYTQSGDFGDIVIHGLDGNDSITVSPTVTDATLIYGGNGNDTINALGLGKMTIVTIGNGTNTVTGNGINTSYWVNPNDIVHASAFEIAQLNVNRVGNFYQPFSTDPTNAQYIPRTLAGQDLPDPTDSGTTTRLTSSSFWGTGPAMSDINQGLLSDCYFEAPLASLAFSNPGQLENMGVDLGDGTYAVRFIRNGVSIFVRVDGDLPAGGPFTDGLVNNFPGASGNQWGSIFEKAYAFFRSGQNTYASLNVGFTDAALTDLGVASVCIAASSDSNVILADITSALAANKPVVVSTSTAISGGAPLIAFHAYTIVGAFLDSTGMLNIQLRNPWGIDGFNVDSNPNDGLITIAYSDFAANCVVMTYAM